MNTDRFKDFEPEVRRLVLAFEEGAGGGFRFFDVEELEVIADYYMEVRDLEGLEKAVVLGERLYPHSGAIRLRRAHLLGVEGRYGQALRLLRQLEQEEPDNTDVSYSLATLYSMTGNPKASIDYYRRAAADGYGLGAIYGNMGDEYVRLGDTVQAVRHYRKAVASDADEQRSLYALWGIWESQGRYVKAVRFFARHVEDHPYCKVAWYCLGCAYLRGGRVDAAKAADALEYAVAIDNRFEEAYTELAEAYMELGDLHHAVQAFRDMLDFTADRHHVLRDIGNLYMVVGNYHTAYAYFRDAIKENPDNGFAWNDLGRCCEKLGYSEEAAGHYNRAITLEPDYDDLWLDLADLYIAQLRFAEAAALLESARGEADERLQFDSRLLYCYYRLV